MVQPSREKEVLTGIGFTLVILDEAHKARSRQGYGPDAGEPNALLAFMLAVADRAEHILLGTATPIQTKPEDLWDLVRVLHRGSTGFVLGNDLSPWHDPERVLPILCGEERVDGLDDGWRLLRSPLPTMASSNEPNARLLFRNLREELDLAPAAHLAGALSDLPRDLREDLETELERVIDGATFFQRENPFVRHMVLRKRTTLEERGLLERIAVHVHPDRGLVQAPHRFSALFQDTALRTTPGFDRAYEEARAFGRVLAKRGKGGGFMRNLMEQRLSERMRNRYDLFGGLPDTIRDDWIDDLETLGERMDLYIEERRQATGFDLRYNSSITPSDAAWRDCAAVLSRRDVENLMRQGWGG